jgi:uncharacterized membrane-anchored protein
MTARKAIYLAALLLPIVFLGITAARHAWHMTAAPKYTVLIEGYDPRDLVYGEYLQFRYDWANPASERPADAQDLPETGRVYLPEGNAWDLQTMMWEDKNVFTVDARLMGGKAYAGNLRIDGRNWQEALDVWRQNRDNQSDD